MKRFFTSSLLLFFVAAMSQAQVKISVNICPQINESLGIRAGSDFDIPITKQWSFVPGAYWSLRNRQSTQNTTVNDKTTNIKYSDKAHFITLPLRFGVRIPCRNENSFALKLLFGPYMAFGIGGTSKSTTDSDGTITRCKTGAFDKHERIYRWHSITNRSMILCHLYSKSPSSLFRISINCNIFARGILKFKRFSVSHCLSLIDSA